MKKINSLIMKEKSLPVDLVKFFLLTGIAVAAPLINQQAVTGPLVNAVLFISVAVLGLRWGLSVAMVPSIIALSVGTLPLIMAPMVPLIIIGNFILIAVFHFFAEKNYWLGIISASFLKFIFLAGTSALMSELFFKNQLGAKIAVMMSWPQLFTAIAGGLVAYFFLKILQKD
jgi:hypothetical protein